MIFVAVWVIGIAVYTAAVFYFDPKNTDAAPLAIVWPLMLVLLPTCLLYAAIYRAGLRRRDRLESEAKARKSAEAEVEACLR